jgi:hypothetical protein
VNLKVNSEVRSGESVGLPRGGGTVAMDGDFHDTVVIRGQAQLCRAIAYLRELYRGCCLGGVSILGNGWTTCTVVKGLPSPLSLVLL